MRQRVGLSGPGPEQVAKEELASELELATKENELQRASSFLVV